jgi:hypothetical protein
MLWYTTDMLGKGWSAVRQALRDRTRVGDGVSGKFGKLLELIGWRRGQPLLEVGVERSHGAHRQAPGGVGPEHREGGDLGS